MGLFKGKKRAEADQNGRRAVRSQSAGRPDFIYYANRRSVQLPIGKGGAPERSRSLLNAPVGAERSPTKRRRGVLFWLAIAASLVLVVQLTVVDGHSSVVILQADGTKSSEGVASYTKTANQLLASSVLNRSKITIDARGIADQLRKLHPEVESAVLAVPLFGGHPTLYISLSEPAFILQQASNRYMLSASGYITGLAPEKTELPLVRDDTGETVALGTQLLPQSSVQFMKTVHYQLEQANINISALLLPAKKAYEIDAQLEGKPYVVRFNLQEDALQQSGAAIATIEQLGTTVPAIYLDVRVPERVYYK